MAKRLGALIDCSRNCVYTVDALKKFIDILADIGYDYLQLYTEDTFDIGDPRFGYLRGRYNVAEIKELDGYASARGIELIPFIQTLGHLKGVTRWWAYSDICDTGNILLAGEEKTYALIDKMFAACAEMYTSRNINIGMDEADMVGLGKYLSKHGYRNRYDVLLEHLRNVCDIAKKYGFKPMMWSDMFFRLANDGSYKVSDGFVVPKEIIDKVPPEVRLIYWDYYSKDKATYDAQFKAHKQFRNEILFAGGAWCWNGFAPHNNWSVRINKEAFISCNDNGINDICITEWKDDGGESSLFSVLPALFASAQFFRGNYDMMDIKCKFGNPYLPSSLSYALSISFLLITSLSSIIPDSTQNELLVNPSRFFPSQSLSLPIYHFLLSPQPCITLPLFTAFCSSPRLMLCRAARYFSVLSLCVPVLSSISISSPRFLYNCNVAITDTPLPNFCPCLAVFPNPSSASFQSPYNAFKQFVFSSILLKR